jgi:redox-sensing transcriptional repressor
MLTYFAGRRPNLLIKAAFDSDPQKVNRVINGTRCYDIRNLAEVVRQENITTAILAVPAGHAQTVTDQLLSAGIKGILNFAPAHIHVPSPVYVENVDITTSLEKVAFFARQKS